MKRLRIFFLKRMEAMAVLFGKDPMKYRIKRYRLYGAKIGENVRAFSDISSLEPYLITIGDNVTVAVGVRFFTHDNSAIKLYEDATDFVGPIVIGNNVFIGGNSIILPGVSIADNCIIGAGSVVCKSITEPGMVLAGNPAKIIGTVEAMREKYKDNRMNLHGKNRYETIMGMQDKWLKK